MDVMVEEGIASLDSGESLRAKNRAEAFDPDRLLFIGMAAGAAGVPTMQGNGYRENACGVGRRSRNRSVVFVFVSLTATMLAS
jgi:hypothetical protein